MMRQLFLMAGIMLTGSLFSQEFATTERGDTVVLYDNGQWDYLENYVAKENDEIPFNSDTFKKPKKSSKKIKGLNGVYELWYDPSIWKRIPVGDLNEEADIALEMIKGDAYAMIIYEEIEIPEENLSSIALSSAQEGSPGVRMMEREWRIVNSDSLVYMSMAGPVEGMQITFRSYYHANPNGAMQFHIFTGTSVIKKYKREIDDLLNGFVVRKR